MAITRFAACRARLLVGGLAGCVTEGDRNPMDTRQGRMQARDAYIQLGLGYVQQGNTEQAKVPLKKALSWIVQRRRPCRARTGVPGPGRNRPADQEYRLALRERPHDARILNNYGSFLYEQGRYKDAYERFTQAAEDSLYPERARVFENLGLTALRLNQVDLGKENLEKSLRLDRNQPRALFELAQLAYQTRDYVPSRSYYQAFSQLSPQDARSLLLGIRLAEVFNDRNTAASYALQLKRLYPNSPEYRQLQSEQK